MEFLVSIIRVMILMLGYGACEEVIGYVIQQIPTDSSSQKYIDFYYFKDVIEMYNTPVKLRSNPWKDDIL